MTLLALPVLALGVGLGVSLSLGGCAAGDPVGSFVPLSEPLLEGGEAWVHALPDGRLLSRAEGRLRLSDPARPSAAPLVIAPAEILGEIRASVSLDGSILVLGREGAAVLAGNSWLSSELEASLDASARAAITVPREGGGEDLWIATDSSLYRYRDGRLRLLDLDGADLSAAQLCRARTAYGEGLWVLLPDRVLEISSVGSEVRTAQQILGFLPEQIASDASGRVWMIAGGQLRSMGPDRSLRQHGIAATSLFAHPGSELVWLLDPAGRPIVHTEEGFFAASEALPEALSEALLGAATASTGSLATGRDGALYAASEGSLRRLGARHPLALEGPSEGAVLVTPETFLILAGDSGGEGLEVLAELDGEALEVLEAPWSVEIRPAEIGDGVHTLRIRTRRGDGTLPSELSRSFEVISGATWSEDVAPLYEEHCSGCHGAEGVAHTRLDEASLWPPIFETIVANLREGRMPLGREPLSQREVARIQAWQIAGFPD